MNTQTIHAPQGWTFPSLGRFFAFVALWVDAYSEALQQAHDARQRYPYASE